MKNVRQALGVTVQQFMSFATIFMMDRWIWLAIVSAGLEAGGFGWAVSVLVRTYEPGPLPIVLAVCALIFTVALIFFTLMFIESIRRLEQKP